MSFVRGLLAGRSHLAVLLGLAAAAVTVGAVHRLVPDESGPGPVSLAALDAGAKDLPLRPRGPLEPDERRLARAAFAYLGRNADARTGLAPAVAGQHAATLWETGSQLLGLLAAEDLGLLARADARARIARILRSLGALPLGEGGLPNKAYDVRTLAMVEVDGRPAARDVGWSALDVARALLPLSIVARRHPELAPLAVAAVGRWRLDALSDGRTLRGASRRADGVLETYVEGRLGYEQHAAKALLAWGVPAPDALDWRAHLALTRVAGQLVPRDDRRPREHGGAPAALVPEPWLLDALEHGPDAVTLPVIRSLLRVQARRDAAVGRLTAVSEDALDAAPWFSYSAIVNGDDTWTALGPDGSPAPGTLTFSTKAAVAWGALFDGPYPRRLLAAAAELVVPGEGLYAGRYDATGRVNRVLSLNTSAVVLEALAYRVRGPAVRAGLAPPAEGAP